MDIEPYDIVLSPDSDNGVTI